MAGLDSYSGLSMNVYAVQVVVVVMVRPTVSPSPGDLNSVPHIWVKVTVDFKQENREWQGWGVCGGLIRTLTHTNWGPLLCVPVIGLGGASGGYLMWRLLSETWI